ncbi:hypothetical protein QEN19_000172 [Hanseniaspora menglaensis]
MLRSKLSSFREYMTPVSNDSKYIENGTITPNEFVIAGNYLADKFVTWTWNSEDTEVSEKNLKIKSFLPKEKQFLVTRKVVCYKRCEDLQKDENELAISGTVEVFDEDNNVWIVKPKEKIIEKAKETVHVDESGYNLDEEELESDGEDQFSVYDEIEDSINKRYYDLFIFYSTSYKVPKMYLVGFNNEGQPLSPKEMLSDVSPEYRKKTATIENLPIFDNKIPSISIHPCKHGNVMKLLMSKMKESRSIVSEGKDLTVDSYLVIFLKFMNSVIPTMEYDFTMDSG